jgi:hypothetical protein
MPVCNPGRGQRLVQRCQGLGRTTCSHPALRERAVQVNKEVGLHGMGKRAIRHLLGTGRITETIESVSKPAHKAVMLC